MRLHVCGFQFLVLFGGFLPILQPAYAQQYASSTQYLDAEIVNLRRDSTGQVLATVIFTSKVRDGFYISINNNSKTCSEGASLIDGLGNEYLAKNCINTVLYYGSNADFQHNYSRPGLRIDGNGTNPYVFRFETPLRADASANEDVNMSVQVAYFYSPNTNMGVNGSTTFSFYGMKIPYTAPQVVK